MTERHFEEVSTALLSHTQSPMSAFIPFSHLSVLTGEGVKNFVLFSGQYLPNYVTPPHAHRSCTALSLDGSTYLFSEVTEMGMIFLNMKYCIKSVGGKYAV